MQLILEMIETVGEICPKEHVHHQPEQFLVRWSIYCKINIISYVTISTLGNAQDFGDLDLARNQTAALSDSHGGLG